MKVQTISGTCKNQAMPFNLPIFLTWLRVALVPLLVGIFYLPEHWMSLYAQSLTAAIIFIVAAIQIFFGFYAMIFLRRIMRDIVGLDGNHATLMTVFCFSFAFVMLSSMVPDHFIISMMLLLLTLHLSGQWMKDGRRMTAWHTIVLFMLTAGTSLNNGLKTFMSALFVNGRRFFRPSYILAAVILPSALLWTCSRLEYDHIVWPRDMARNEAKARLKAKKEAEQRQKSRNRRLTLQRFSQQLTVQKRLTQASIQKEATQMSKKLLTRQKLCLLIRLLRKR